MDLFLNIYVEHLEKKLRTEFTQSANLNSKSLVEYLHAI